MASNNYECCANLEPALLNPEEPKMGESNRQEKSSGHGNSSPSNFQVDAETEIDHKQDNGKAHNSNELRVEEIFEVTKSACSKWKSIGRNLGFRHDELSAITRVPGQHDDEDFYADMLSRWLNWAPPIHNFPKAQDLSSALRKAGKERQASALSQNYRISETNISPTQNCSTLVPRRDKDLPSHGSTTMTHMHEAFKIKSFINQHKYWMTSYIIMCIMIVVSLPLYSYIYSCSNLTDYKERINSGDTIIVPIHRQYLVTSLTVSVDSACQGTLYLVPANEMTLRYRNRERDDSFNDAFLYLGSNSVIHFTKAATNHSLQVWVTNSLEIAGSIANHYEYSCASPPNGTTCHQFLTRDENWDCIINETSYYWIEITQLQSRSDIRWNFTSYYYNQTDYSNDIYFHFDSTHLSAQVQINPGLFEFQEVALLFGADEGGCQYQYIQISDIKTRVYEFFGVSIILCTLLVVVVIAHVCNCRKKRNDVHWYLLA